MLPLHPASLSKERATYWFFSHWTVNLFNKLSCYVASILTLLSGSHSPHISYKHTRKNKHIRSHNTQTYHTCTHTTIAYIHSNTHHNRMHTLHTHTPTMHTIMHIHIYTQTQTLHSALTQTHKYPLCFHFPSRNLCLGELVCMWTSVRRGRTRHILPWSILVHIYQTTTTFMVFSINYIIN